MVKKYISVVKEDTYGVEKYSQSDLSTATRLKDYISTDASEGNHNSPDLSEKGDVTALSSGHIRKKDKIYFEPEYSLIGGLADYFFLAMSTGEVKGDATDISNLTSGQKMFVGINSKQNTSFTVLTNTIYDDAVDYMLGFQLGELNLALETGEVAIECNGFASRNKLDETNLSRGVSSYLGNVIQYSQLKDISLASITKDEDVIQLPTASSSWTSVGCDIVSGEFNTNFNLDEDSGFGFCNDGWANGFDCGALEVEASVEINQHSDIWKKLVFGNNSEFTNLAKKSIKFTLNDGDYQLDIIMPDGVVGLDGANVRTENDTETVNFTNETANVSYGDDEDNVSFDDIEALLELTKL
ncbi:MAG: hypothetical protein LBM96_00690 [Methanobrevibacter sp.]|jgi:hypothetical protein|nr:hypothetical protein [Candidatus Methanoflexus mossambicus]